MGHKPLYPGRLAVGLAGKMFTIAGRGGGSPKFSFSFSSVKIRAQKSGVHETNSLTVFLVETRKTAETRTGPESDPLSE